MEKMKYGMLGTANIARRATIPGMKSIDNSEFFAVAGRNAEKVDEFVRDYGFQKGYYSYEELLDDKDIEAIYIPLPNSMHCEWAIKAMKKGKHVLCEKPIACTAEDAEKMFATAKECGVMLMEAYAYLHAGLVESIKNVLDSGVIGKPVLMESCFFTMKAPDTNVRRQRNLMGGAIYDIGCYPTSLALYLFGEMPTEVGCNAHFTEGGIDELDSAFLRYADGKSVFITVGMCSSIMTSRMNIYCEKGAIFYNDGFNAKGQVSYTLQTEEGTKVVTLDDVPDNYGLEIQKFTNAIRNGESMIVDEEFSVGNAKILDMLLESNGYNKR